MRAEVVDVAKDVRVEEHGLAALVQSLDDALHLDPADRVEPGHGLVQQDEFRVVDFLQLELLKLEKMGFKYEITKKYLSRNGKTNLVDLKTFSSKLVALEEKIHPLPSSAGINIDNLPFFVPVAIMAKGETLIHDWVYENRAIYFVELNKLGAKVKLMDPHRVLIEGPRKLTGVEMTSPPALRPGAIILVAMLAAKGKSVLKDVYHIERGYENLVERLQKLGAGIKKKSK